MITQSVYTILVNVVLLLVNYQKWDWLRGINSMYY